ncbi:MAG: hypothetical protein OXN83_02915 [Oligoflexia bacterium]|nr:hypothetical protein [Oligoflexia bacterium]
MSNFKPPLKTLLKGWMKLVAVFNNSLIFVFLLVIWILIVTPTALIRKLFQTIKGQQMKKPDSFFKKPLSLDSEHFTRPF